MVEYLKLLKETLGLVDQKKVDEFVKLLNVCTAKIFVFGNGGSATTATHFAVDMSKGVGISVICLNDNVSVITAYANDFGYDYVFSKQLETLMEVGDIVVAISGSGNSDNVVKAVEYAKSCGNKTVGFTGFNGGVLKEIVDLEIRVPIKDMQIVEDIHLILNHIIYKCLTEKY